MAFTRLSPGVYRGANGQTVRSPTMPQARPQVPPPRKDVSIMPVRNPAQEAGERRRYQEAVNRLGRFAPGSQEYGNNAGIIKDIGSRLGFNWQKQVGANFGQTPPTAAAEPAPAPPAAPQAPAPQAEPMADVTNYQSPMTKSLLEALGKGTNTSRAWEPQNYQGSPLYQFQKDKGMGDLQKLMAARGLTNSGAEIQANSDFVSQLNATEADKARSLAEAEMGRNNDMLRYIAGYDQTERMNLQNQLNTDAERRMAQQQFEAGRQDNRQRLTTDFLSNVLQMQSNNPIAQLAYQGLGQQTELTNALMKAISSNVASNYPRSYGGGGGVAPTPPPGGELDIARILMGYGNSAGNNDVLNGVLRSIFG